ncbi:MAG: dockerin type I domain-containing protein [Terrimicrobiaceae bacterium]|nr:dockerin type I domain-containing protein [Terrimicrobiaceae bacterium]
MHHCKLCFFSLAFISLSLCGRAALIFEDDASSITGGVRSLGSASSITAASPLVASPDSGSYLKSSLAVGDAGATIVTYTPAGPANSWSALTGSVTVGGTTYVTLNGGFDLFVRVNTAEAGTAWFRPVDISTKTASAGMRLILNGAGGSQIQLEISTASATGLGSSPGSFTTNDSFNLPNSISGAGNPMTPGTVAHLGITFNTNPGTGQVTMKLFGASNGGAIDTSSNLVGIGNLIGMQTFYISAAAVGASVLPTGAWSPTARSYPSATFGTATNVDYDTIRLWNSDPGTFPGLSATPPPLVGYFTAFHIGNSLTQDMFINFRNVGTRYEATQGTNYLWGYHFRPGTSLTFIYNNPNDTISTRSAVGLTSVSAQPATNLVPWPTALPGNTWSVVTMEPFPDSTAPATLATDTASVNGMIAAARTNANNASTRFFIYEAWPTVVYSDLNSNSAAYLAPIQNIPSQPSTLARDYFTYLVAAVRQTNPNIEVIPVGEALNALDIKMRAGQFQDFTSIRDLHRDGIHMNSVGQNVAAWTAYAAIFRQSPVGLVNDVNANGVAAPFVNNTAISPADMLLMQQTIWDVVSQQPKPPTFASAVSREVQGGINYDIGLPQTGAAAVEGRAPVAGTYKLILTFDQNVISGTAAVTGGTGSVSSTSINGATMTVNLSGVANQQTLVVTASNVTNSVGQFLAGAAIKVRVLQGDVNGDGAVNAADLTGVRNAYGKSAGQAGFDPRADLNGDGAVNAADITSIRNNYGLQVP